MKHHSFLYLFIVLLLGMSSCASKRMTAEQKQTMLDSVSRMVSDSIVNRTFTVDVNYVSPQRMDARFLNSTYSLRILNDSIMSNLPYYGTAYKVSPYREGPLDFDGNIKAYTVTRPTPDVVRVKFFTVNKLEYLEYILDFESDGKCSIEVKSADRDKINFQGEMVL